MRARRRPSALHASIIGLGALLVLGLVPPVQALDPAPCSLEILIDGRPATELAARGTHYIEAVEGQEYAIRLTNRSGRRIAVALSVDGLNTIDAKTTSAADASKWILGPFETITLEGWQTSSQTARRFFFTTEAQSYGAWLDRTSNLGLISAAVFREREAQPSPVLIPRSEERSGRKSQTEPDRDAPAPSAGEPRSEAAEKLSDELAATGIGREVGHSVRRVRFEAEPRPAAVLELRYEYHDALVRLGVLPRPYACEDDPLERRERARGFEPTEFAPDPFRR